MLLPDQIDPFSLSAIHETAVPALLPLHPVWDGFQFEKSLESGLLRLNEADVDPLSSLKADVFQLDLQDVPLPDLSAASIPSSDSEDDYFQSLDGSDVEDEAIDVWVLPDIQKRRLNNALATWDIFLDSGHQEPASAYLSEVPVELNTILDAEGRNAPNIVKPDVLLSASIGLCLGRNSVLFSWEDKNKVFVPQWHDIAAHQYSRVLVQSCFEDFAAVGMRIRIQWELFQKLMNSFDHLSTTQIAFLCSSSSILHAIDRYLCSATPDIVSLLQLQGHVSKIRTMMDVLDQCIVALDSEKAHARVVQSIIQGATLASLDHPDLLDIMQLLVSRTCQPSLASLGEAIGLSSPQSHALQHRSTETGPPKENFWEALFSSDIAELIRETQQSLDHLEKYSPDCALLSTSVLRSSPLKALTLGFTFNAVNRLQARAMAYEEAMQSLIVSAETSASTSMLDTPGSDTLDLEETVTTPIAPDSPFRLEVDLFNVKMAKVEEDTGDEIEHQVVLFLAGHSSEESELPLDFEESVSLSITPLVSAQHRLLSYSVLRLLFQDHNLLAHLSLQRNFHMLGDAFFSSRLRTALFDSDQLSGESRRKTGASTGLRLEARDSWPPAGSELRLVLMSILSDSLTTRDRPLENCISFAIRDMPLEELEKCRDVDSIHALDFLRLQYNPPNQILEAVITPQILDKYDRIFQHLLRTMRVQAVTQRMLRDNFAEEAGLAGERPRDKIVIEMHHFTSSVADYCHNVGIQAPWTSFENILRNAERHLNSQNYEETLRVVKSLRHLKDLHERTLDNMLQALLLKQKQTAIRQNLEAMYGVILRFSAEKRKRREMIMEGRQSDVTLIEEKIGRLGQDFRDKVLLFIDRLNLGRSAAFQAPGTDHSDDLHHVSEDLDLYECLLLRLDMLGYWRRRKGGGPAMMGLPSDLL